MKKDQKIYSKTKGLRFRKGPDASDPKNLNLIRELEERVEMVFLDGPWLKVKIDKQEGWVHADYVSDEAPTLSHAFKISIPNLANDAMTLLVRKEINDEYGGGKNGWELQCKEYATFRVKTKLGVTIAWPVQSGRHGGKWADIFEKHKKYKVLAEPKANCTMSFTMGISSNQKTNEIGHVAFVEEVYPDGSIRISEANWPRNGIYNERVLTVAEWKDKYKGRFVEFV